MVDAGTKRCPFVLLSLKKALAAAPAGQLLAVRTVDPQAVADIQAWCRAAGNAFEGSEQADRVTLIYVRKPAGAAT